MKTLTQALIDAYGAPVQKPAWLIEMVLDQSTARLCSFATVPWISQTWMQEDINVSGISVEALAINGVLVLGNATDNWGAVALTEGFTDKRIRIWGYDAGIAAPATSDPQLVCDAVGGGVDEIGETRVVIRLRDASEYRLAPRGMVVPEFGFRTLLPAGRTLTINGISFVLSRGR